MIDSSKTAISRKGPSKPLRFFLNKIYPKNYNHSFLDFGCGKGADVKYLLEKDFKVIGFDPYTNRNYNIFQMKFDVVLLTYVLNVIYNSIERKETFLNAWRLVKPKGYLVVSCRPTKQIEKEAIKNKWKQFNDGFITSAKTFQVGFDKNKFSEYECLLNCDPFFFRDNQDFSMRVFQKNNFKRFSEAPKIIRF